MSTFSEGVQPCEDFKKAPHETHTHDCPHCHGDRQFCGNCNADHHSGGWALCWELQSLRKLKKAFEAWRAGELNMDFVDEIVDEINETKLHYGNEASK